MSDDPAPKTFRQVDGTSSLFEKTDPDLRRKINQAIVNRSPQTYRGVYEKFDLQSHGVSFTAFYYYARRLRMSAALRELAVLTTPEEQALQARLTSLLGQRLFETLLDEEASPQNIQRLMNAYRMGNQMDLLRRQFTGRDEAEKRKAANLENNALCRIAKQCAHMIDEKDRAQYLTDIETLAGSTTPTKA